MTTANNSMAHGDILGAASSDTGTTTQLMEDHRNCLAARNELATRNPPSRLQSSRFACLRCCGNLLNYVIRLRNTPEELEQRYKSKEIDKFLEKEKQTFRRQVSNVPHSLERNSMKLFCFTVPIVMPIKISSLNQRLNFCCWVLASQVNRHF